MRLSRAILVNGYAVVGVDDWLVSARDPAGKWVYWHTECDPAWRGFPRADAGLGDDPVEDVVAVGVMMARRGVNPYRIEDPLSVADCEFHFGDAVRPGHDPWIGVEP